MLRSGLVRRWASNVPATAAPGGVVVSGKYKDRIETVMKYGPGGRSSVSGIVATVFGSTGFLGRYVVNRLGKVGSQVLLPYRGDEHDWRHLKLMGDLGQINATFYDPRDPDAIARMVEHSNVVFNFIGRDYETKNFSFTDAHVTIPTMIAEASKKAGVSRLIHVSSLGAAEDSPSAFLRSKWEGEQAVQTAFPEATIVRPASMFGQEDHFLHKLAYLHFMPLVYGDPLVNEGKKQYLPVFVSDVAEALVRMMKDSDTSSQIYELVGSKQYTYAELLDMFSEVTKRPINPINYPPALLRGLVTVMSKLPPSPKISPEDLVRMEIDEVKTPNVPGFEVVNVVPQTLEQHSLDVLRRYRSAAYFDEPAESRLVKED